MLKLSIFMEKDLGLLKIKLNLILIEMINKIFQLGANNTIIG